MRNVSLALVMVFCIGLFGCGGSRQSSSVKQKKAHRIKKRQGSPVVSSKRRSRRWLK